MQQAQLQTDTEGPVVTAAGLVRRFGEGDTTVTALRGVSVEIERGALTAVMGPSGSGKSTLMHILAGLDKPSEGSVKIDGTEYLIMKESDIMGVLVEEAARKKAA